MHLNITLLKQTPRDGQTATYFGTFPNCVHRINLIRHVKYNRGNLFKRNIISFVLSSSFWVWTFLFAIARFVIIALTFMTFWYEVSCKSM